jgi:hypothetical protein
MHKNDRDPSCVLTSGDHLLGSAAGGSSFLGSEHGRSQNSECEGNRSRVDEKPGSARLRVLGSRALSLLRFSLRFADGSANEASEKDKCLQ